VKCCAGEWNTSSSALGISGEAQENSDEFENANRLCWTREDKGFCGMSKLIIN
jgi:hypothetical protein